jgi:hypothetical protein
MLWPRQRPPEVTARLAESGTASVSIPRGGDYLTTARTGATNWATARLAPLTPGQPLLCRHEWGVARVCGIVCRSGLADVGVALRTVGARPLPTGCYDNCEAHPHEYTSAEGLTRRHHTCYVKHPDD